MKQIIPLFNREFAGYFRSPIAYVLLIVFLLVLIGMTWFLGGFFQNRDANLERMFIFIPWIFMVFIPAVGMRLWAEEKKTGTCELLFTLPVSVGEAVIAKYLAAWAFIGLALVLTFPMPLTIEYLGDPDWGPIFTGYFGAFLMAGAFLGIASLASALTRNQVIAFVLAKIVCVILVISGYSAFGNFIGWMPVWLVDALANFSVTTHFEPLKNGLMTLKDILFFVSVAGFGLILNVIVLSR